MLPGAVIAAQGAEIVVVQRLETGFGIDLGGRKIQVAEELPDLVDGNLSGVQQGRGDGMPQQMGVDSLCDTGCRCRAVPKSRIWRGWCTFRHLNRKLEPSNWC
jgi:hypothetical protein